MNPQRGNPAPSSSAPVGIFDSGIGGLSILRALREELPHEDFVYVADTSHAPYGEREDGFVIERARLITRVLQQGFGIKALVVACNTATAAAIHLLRQDHPGLPIIGVEPALKPAAQQTRTGRIGVLATRATLASTKFQTLLDSLAPQAAYACQPCDGLAQAIENADLPATRELCARYTQALGPLGTRPGDIDTLVLGCTHYPFAAEVLGELLGPDVRLLDSGAPVARHARRVLTQHGLLNAQTGPGHLILRATGTPRQLEQAARHWLAPDLAAQILPLPPASSPAGA